jgi:hypothetical protein
VLYEWRKGTWTPTVVLPEVDCTHSIRLVDFDRDGHLDVWVAEMRLDAANPGAKNQLLFGDGKGGFEPVPISEGFGLHESEIADLDGDGDLDVLGKPYNWDAPRLDEWINEGPEEPAAAGARAGSPRAAFAHRVVDDRGPRNPWTKVVGDLDGDGRADIVVGGEKGPLAWYRAPLWDRHPIADGGYSTVDGETCDVDGDGDGRLDVVTRDQTEWAKAGHTVHVFLQGAASRWAETVLSCPEGEGLATADLDGDGREEALLAAADGIHAVRVPGDPAAGPWPSLRIAARGSDEGFAVADVDGDGDLDVAGGDGPAGSEAPTDVAWWENPGEWRADWRRHAIGQTLNAADRVAAADLDGDGRVDVAVAEERYPGEKPDANLWWFAQSAAGARAPSAAACSSRSTR